MATKFPETKDGDREIPSVDLELIAQGVRLILEGIGEDPDRVGLHDTPRRVAERAIRLLRGYRVLSRRVFRAGDGSGQSVGNPKRTRGCPANAASKFPYVSASNSRPPLFSARRFKYC